MSEERGTALSKLLEAIREFQAREDRKVDLKGLRKGIDALECEFSVEARSSQLSGDNLADGSAGVVTWLSRLCGMSVTSAADRVCVGKQLESLPKISEALRSGQISYQSTALLCHLRDQLGDQREYFDEDEMLEHARNQSVGRLRYLCRIARHIADPDGFFNDAEADFTNRRLEISQMGDGMFCVDAILDPECGAALKTALDSLAKRLGPDDDRSHKQRMADSMTELVNHAMDEGRLPRRHGVRPHINVTTTLEGLKNEFGAPPADLELSLPISTRTLERLACDCTISRVLLADSMVIDVGRATRVISAPTRRALECAIGVADGMDAIVRSTGRPHITSSSGLEVVLANSPTLSCFATSTIGSFTRAVGRWSRQVESFDSCRQIGWSIDAREVQGNAGRRRSGPGGRVGSIVFAMDSPSRLGPTGRADLPGERGGQRSGAEPDLLQRLTQPLVRDGGRLRPASWDEALDAAAAGFAKARALGPNGFGMFSCSKTTNEMNFMAQKFTRVVMGSNNVDSCNRT